MLIERILKEERSRLCEQPKNRRWKCAPSDIKGKGKGKFYPITGHEGPAG